MHTAIYVALNEKENYLCWTISLVFKELFILANVFSKSFTTKKYKGTNLVTKNFKSLWPRLWLICFCEFSYVRCVFKQNTYKKDNQRVIKHDWQIIVSLNWFRNAYCYLCFKNESNTLVCLFSIYNHFLHPVSFNWMKYYFFHRTEYSNHCFHKVKWVKIDQCNGNGKAAHPFRYWMKINPKIISFSDYA